MFAIFIIIIVLLLTVCPFYDSIECSNRRGFHSFLYWGAFIASLIFCIIYGNKVTTNAEKEKILIETTKIYSLEDNTTSTGNFVMGTGEIESEHSYFVLVKKKKGDQIIPLSSKNTYLNYEDNARVEYFRETVKNPLERLFYFGKTDFEYQLLYIPEEAVKKKFNIDLN